MSLCRSEETSGDFEPTDTNEENDSANDNDMSSTEVEKAEPEFHLASDTIDVSPRSAHSGVSSSEIFTSPTRREQNARQRPKSARSPMVKTAVVQKPTPPLSSIPLPVKTSGPIKIPPLLKNATSASRTSSIAPRTPSLANKHTLEIQFINKNKRYIQMRKELVEKQRPILDLYQNLIQIKKRLEGLGKNVKLEEVKLIPFEEYNKKPSSSMGAGEQVSMEVVNSMKSSIEEIPKTLMGICKNLLSRRALIVELLESVTKSEVDVAQVSDKIESLKCEGQQLQQSLDAVIQEHESKISNLVNNWQKLLSDKQCYNADSKIEELENRIKEEERLREESSTIIHDLHRKMEERRLHYDKSIAELNGVLQTLREQIRKLEQDLDNERKTTVDFKSRNNNNAQSLKMLRTKITELENDKKEVETSNSELQKKVRLLQDQLKHKESQWTKEKDEMAKNLKHQENLLQKLTADKNQFETRLGAIEDAKSASEKERQATISSLTEELEVTRTQLSVVTSERDEAVQKCHGFESYVARMSAECKESMNKVSYSIEWGKATREVRVPEAENYMHDVVKDLRIRELEDKITDLERERETWLRDAEASEDTMEPSKIEMRLNVQNNRIKGYQLLLEESENKLKNKLGDLRSAEVENLRAEIRQLKVRQESLEEQNERFSAHDMQRMLDEGRQKLNELMRRSVQSDTKLEEYLTVIEKQKVQLTEMNNLLRYRENMANVLKSSRNELLTEKESLSRYSREVRAALAEVTEESSRKDSMIKSLQERVTLREKQLRSLEKEIEELEEKLQMTNEKRYKLQETVGSLEKELQKSQVKIDQLSGIKNKPSMPWSFLDSVYEVIEDKPNKKVSHYCNSLMAGQDEYELDLGRYDRNIKQNLKYSVSSRKRLHEFRNSQKTFHRGYDSPVSLKSSEYSSNKLSYQNLSFVDNNSSIHTHCHHKANSRSLISLSLQTVDFMKTKLNFLSSVNTTLPENVVESQQESNQTQVNSTESKHSHRNPTRNLSKILELTAKRYEYLQNQAQESYDDFANLVKLAVTQEGAVKK